MAMGRTFARTPNGIKNYNAFHNVDFIIYTEGRCHSGTAQEDTKAYDTKYYLSLVQAFTAHKRIKVMLVGNKLNALDYHKSIIDNKIQNCIVFIDKDYDGLFCSIINQPKLLMTYGYSWENDFWTKRLCRDIVYNLSMKDISIVNLYNSKASRCIGRLDKISRIQASGQFFSINMLPNSGSKSKGIGINGDKKWPISKNEFRRVKIDSRKKLHGHISKHYLDFLKSILDYKKTSFYSIIQGHLFEHAILLVISDCYKIFSEKKTADQSIIKNLAFSIFDEDVKHYLTKKALAHYAQEFMRI
ncbi:DUF4435 domain-containing protein [Aeromonas dhakensis]|uniref:DUF4435 domain-containing protein n=1 Tax=Aeromonas dhakensis TaxID=196024 RepID=UPI0009EEEFA4|nr:DUF4435 domain-containing protein [Aeromonas dhakensis]